MPPLALATTTQPRTVTTVDDGWYRAVTSLARHTAWLQRPMEVFTLASILVLAAMVVWGWWGARSRGDQRAMAAVMWVGLGTVLSTAAGLTLKQVFQETRPCDALAVPTVQTCPGPTDYSFPSDHMTVAVALAVGLWIVNRRLGVVALVLAVIEGFSRIYLGQHYPHDVLAAVVLSSVVMIVGWRFARGLLMRLVASLERTPLAPLLTAR